MPISLYYMDLGVYCYNFLASLPAGKGAKTEKKGLRFQKRFQKNFQKSFQPLFLQSLFSYRQEVLCANSISTKTVPVTTMLFS